MQTKSARGSDDGSGTQTRKPRYLTPDQLRAAGDIARATFHSEGVIKNHKIKKFINRVLFTGKWAELLAFDHLNFGFGGAVVRALAFHL